MAAYEETKKSGFYDKNPAREMPIQQMMGKAPTENSKGVRLVNLPQVRDIQNEEFEKMLAGEQTAQQALDNAVDARQRGDQAGARQLSDLPSMPQPLARQRSRKRRGAESTRPCRQRRAALRRIALVPTRHLSQQGPALSAAGAAARHHAGLLLLAGEPGALPVDAARGPVRAADRSSSGSPISSACCPTRTI